MTGSSANLFPRLLSGELDATMTLRPYEEVPELRRHLLFEEPTVLLLPKETAAALRGKEGQALIRRFPAACRTAPRAPRAPPGPQAAH